MKTSRNPVSPLLRIYWSIFRIRAAEGLQYRLAAFAGATTSIFWAAIEIVVFTIFYTYADFRSAGLSAGLSLPQAVSYVWLAQFLFLMQPINIDNEILGKINSGDVGIELCRPLDMYSHWFAKTLAARFVPLVFRGLPVIVAGIFLPIFSNRLSVPASLPGFICMLAGCINALFLCASFSMLMNILRMNVSWGDGPVFMISLTGQILSGVYLPLQLWPSVMQPFLLFQPFAGYLDIPLRLYLGTMQPEHAIGLFAIQAVWITLFILTGKILMRKRIKEIIVQGG